MEKGSYRGQDEIRHHRGAAPGYMLGRQLTIASVIRGEYCKTERVPLLGCERLRCYAVVDRVGRDGGRSMGHVPLKRRETATAVAPLLPTSQMLPSFRLYYIFCALSALVKTQRDCHLRTARH